MPPYPVPWVPLITNHHELLDAVVADEGDDVIKVIEVIVEAVGDDVIVVIMV